MKVSLRSLTSRRPSISMCTMGATQPAERRPDHADSEVAVVEMRSAGRENRKSRRTHTEPTMAERGSVAMHELLRWPARRRADGRVSERVALPAVQRDSSEAESLRVAPTSVKEDSDDIDFNTPSRPRQPYRPVSLPNNSTRSTMIVELSGIQVAASSSVCHGALVDASCASRCRLSAL